MTELRDRLNAHINRILTEVQAEGSSVMDRLQVFRQEPGARSVPRRRRGTRTGRPRQITLKVSVLRSDINSVRLRNDATAPVRVAVALDLTPQQFHQLLRDNITGVPDEFELCRVNGQREVVPLTQQCPMDIHTHHALQRSNLYLRPKNSTSEELTMSNPTTTENVEPPGPITNPAPEDELSPAIPEIQPGVSVSNASSVGGEHEAMLREDVITFSSDEELEEVLLGSPNRSDPDDNVDIKTILNSFRQDNLEAGSTFTVIARRRYVLRSACAALSKSYFGWHKEPSVEFVSEMAADYGGPRREFFRLLMLEVQSSLGIFEGRPGELFFSYDLQALDQNKFYTAGKLTAWSIIHNGPGLRCLNNSLFALMCSQKVDLTNLDLGLLQIENDDQSKIDQIKTCSTEEDLETLKQMCGDWIAGCGVPTVYTANLQDLPRVLNRVVAHFIFHR
ncbi:unnamed protein product [Arctogadus glacialis]